MSAFISMLVQKNSYHHKISNAHHRVAAVFLTIEWLVFFAHIDPKSISNQWILEQVKGFRIQVLPVNEGEDLSQSQNGLCYS